VHLDHLPPLEGGELEHLDAWGRAATYPSVGHLHLRSNPLPRSLLVAEDVQPRPTAPWGPCPVLASVHAHPRRLVRWTDQEVVVLTGPGAQP